MAGDVPATSTAGHDQATSPLVDKGARGLADEGTGPLVTKRTDYEKKAHYIGLRHQDTLDDLVKALRRYGLPDDRSMIVRALIDAAGKRLKSDDGTWIREVAELCRDTLPGTTQNGGTRG